MKIKIQNLFAMVIHYGNIYVREGYARRVVVLLRRGKN